MENFIKGIIKMKIEIELPDEFEEYFRYLKSNFNLQIKKYCENIIKNEVSSRNNELKIF